MKQLFAVIFTGIIVSCYYFSFGFALLPSSVNTKMILAIIGVLLYVVNSIRAKRMPLSMNLLGAMGFAIVFSAICFYSTDINHTNDYTYASYIVSFFTWLGGAYSVVSLIRYNHGTASFRLLTAYLAGVCTAQCILALLIDRVQPLKAFVDRYIDQGQEFLNEVNRLYGIGASLDPAGVRFSIVLVLIAVLLSRNEFVRRDRKYMLGLLSSFFIVSVVGSMVSRTTGLGMIMGLTYLIWSTRIVTLVIEKEYMKFFSVFVFMIAVVAAISTYLYNADHAFHENLRFGFEGFFNWVETGVWKTSSTDKLNSQMWIWPTDNQTWLIGSGTFGLFTFGTDIGYCRFILYCGLIGFGVFALFFVYNGILFFQKAGRYKWAFCLLIMLSFIVWLKVATDIFLIYALFYCFTEREWEGNRLVTNPLAV
ncbi:MAG: hypothetical protein BGN96_05020 [Bacteroidales bacterium 45-6]|nr:MAG: hypothetical protein BGN96_05020 [Bacteroidales bacterium 45-6]